MNNLIQVQIETTTECNGRCCFCPHHKLVQTGTMNDLVFERIINQCTQLPNLMTVIPMLTGEPFLDPAILERIRFIRDQLPWVHIELFTNGSFLTYIIIEQLAKIPDIKLNISLNGLTTETRKTVMGLDDYHSVCKCIEYLNIRKIKYSVSTVAHPAVPSEEIDNLLKAGGKALKYQSWAGSQYPYERKRWTSCTRAMNSLTFNWQGDAVLCCFDYKNDVGFGNINQNTIEEIWNSEKRKRYRDYHKIGNGNELPLCAYCTEG